MGPINQSVTFLNRVHQHKIEGKKPPKHRTAFLTRDLSHCFFLTLHTFISSLYFDQFYSSQYNYQFMNINRRWSTTVWLAIIIYKRNPLLLLDKGILLACDRPLIHSFISKPILSFQSARYSRAFVIFQWLPPCTSHCFRHKNLKQYVHWWWSEWFIRGRREWSWTFPACRSSWWTDQWKIDCQSLRLVWFQW